MLAVVIHFVDKQLRMISFRKESTQCLSCTKIKIFLYFIVFFLLILENVQKIVCSFSIIGGSYCVRPISPRFYHTMFYPDNC